MCSLQLQRISVALALKVLNSAAPGSQWLRDWLRWEAARQPGPASLSGSFHTPCPLQRQRTAGSLTPLFRNATPFFLLFPPPGILCPFPPPTQAKLKLNLSELTVPRPPPPTQGTGQMVPQLRLCRHAVWVQIPALCVTWGSHFTSVTSSVKWGC